MKCKNQIYVDAVGICIFSICLGIDIGSLDYSWVTALNMIGVGLFGWDLTRMIKRSEKLDNERQ